MHRSACRFYGEFARESGLTSDINGSSCNLQYHSDSLDDGYSSSPSLFYHLLNAFSSIYLQKAEQKYAALQRYNDGLRRLNECEDQV